MENFLRAVTSQNESNSHSLINLDRLTTLHSAISGHGSDAGQLLHSKVEEKPVDRLVQEALSIQRQAESAKGQTVSMRACNASEGLCDPGLLRGAATAGGIVAGALGGRAFEWPTGGEISRLISKYPQSAWNSKSWTEISAQNNQRMQLENVASWGAIGSKSHPEAPELLGQVQKRGLRNGLGSGLIGSAINLAIDKTFYPTANYGICSAAFDSFGVMTIASLPAIHPVFKVGAIVGGHVVARKMDNEWSSDQFPAKEPKAGEKLGLDLHSHVNLNSLRR